MNDEKVDSALGGLLVLFFCDVQDLWSKKKKKKRLGHSDCFFEAFFHGCRRIMKATWWCTIISLPSAKGTKYLFHRWRWIGPLWGLTGRQQCVYGHCAPINLRFALMIHHGQWIYLSNSRKYGNSVGMAGPLCQYLTNWHCSVRLFVSRVNVLRLNQRNKNKVLPPKKIWGFSGKW